MEEDRKELLNYIARNINEEYLFDDKRLEEMARKVPCTSNNDSHVLYSKIKRIVREDKPYYFISYMYCTKCDWKEECDRWRSFEGING